LCNRTNPKEAAESKTYGILSALKFYSKLFGSAREKQARNVCVERGFFDIETSDER